MSKDMDTKDDFRNIREEIIIFLPAVRIFFRHNNIHLILFRSIKVTKVKTPNINSIF